MKTGLKLISAALAIALLLSPAVVNADDDEEFRIIVECNSSYWSTYHVNDDLIGENKTREGYTAFGYSRGRGTPDMLPIAKDLLEIKGVSSIKITRFAIWIEKGAAFEWKKIMPLAIEAIKKRYGKGRNLKLEYTPDSKEIISNNSRIRWDILGI